MIPDPNMSVLQALNELQMHSMIDPSPDKRVVLLPPTAEHPSRPIGLPDSACQLVETQIHHMTDVLFSLRIGTTRISELDFLREMSDVVFHMADDSVRLELDAVAQQKHMAVLPLYVALAIYAKYVAAHTTPPLITRDGLDIVRVTPC